MNVFVDTSAVIAVLVGEEQRHKAAASAWERLVRDGAALITTNYVLVELFSLVQRRFGIVAVQALENGVFPILEIAWVDEEIHRRAVAAVLAASKRDLSLVDCVSFEVMRGRGVGIAFTLDRHFSAQGFKRIP